MKHMKHTYKPENALLRAHKESTFEKQLNKRQHEKAPTELNVNSSSDIINKKINQRLKRKQALAAAMNKLHDTDIVG
ncbi:MAG: hypothetical protein EBU33_03520 [Sphingobacteriia bacterium]|nr:hypothetical protein [Sphingobacteriia bacterium]